MQIENELAKLMAVITLVSEIKEPLLTQKKFATLLTMNIMKTEYIFESSERFVKILDQSEIYVPFGSNCTLKHGSLVILQSICRILRFVLAELSS